MNFKKNINVRIEEDDKNKIENIVYNSDDKYSDTSHFIRCAVRRLIRDEEGK